MREALQYCMLNEMRKMTWELCLSVHGFDQQHYVSREVEAQAEHVMRSLSFNFIKAAAFGTPGLALHLPSSAQRSLACIEVRIRPEVALH
jgi:hypothetical protein